MVIFDERLPPRFAAKVSIAHSGCWEWTASRNPKGYGFFKLNHRCLAHRIAYELLVSPIPEDLVIDHLCRNTSCVNPQHLEAVTLIENIRRGVLGTETHCPHGHEYTEANTYVKPPGWRECRTCRTAKPHRKREEAPPTIDSGRAEDLWGAPINPLRGS